MENKPLSKLVKYTYGVTDLFNTTMNNTANLMLVFTLTNVMMFPTPVVLMITGISTTVLAFLTFFTGIIISGTPAMKWGRHRSFMVIFAPLAAIGFVLKFTRLFADNYIAAIFIIIAYIVGNYASSLSSNSHAALVNIFTDDPKERGMLAGHRATAIGAAGIITSYTSIPLVAFLSLYISKTASYTLMATIVGLFYLLTTWYTIWLSKGYEGANLKNGAVESSTKERAPIKLMLACLFKNPSLMTLVFADFSRFAGNLMLMGTTAYFFTYVVSNFPLMAVFTLFGGILQTVGALVSGQLTNMSSKFKIILAEFMIAASLLMVYLFGFNIAVAFPLLLLYRFFQGFGFSMFFTLYTDSVVYGEWKTGLFVPGFTSSMYSVSAQLGTLFNGWFLPAMLIAISFNNKIPAAQASIEMKTNILMLFALIPACFRLLGGLALTFFYKLTPEHLIAYRAEIVARKAAKQ